MYIIPPFATNNLDFGLAYSPLNSAKLSYSSEVMLKLVHRCHAANPLLPPRRRRRRALTTPNFLVDYALSKSLLDYNTDSWCVFDRLSACPFVAGICKHSC